VYGVALQRTETFDPALRKLSLVVALGAIMTVLDATIVNVAVHVLGRDLHASLSTIQWVITGYTLALSMTIPLTGWATQRFGGRTVWLTALSLFIGGSVLCGLAWSAASLIVFRVVQGIGGGLLMPVGQTMLARAAGPQRLGRVMAIVSIPAMLAPALGPVFGGALLDHLSWRWMFYFNVPVCAVALLLAIRLLPADDERDTGSRLDTLGLALLSPGLALFVYGLAQVGEHGRIDSAGALGGLGAGVGLLLAFAVHALRRADRALVDLRLFRDRAFSAAVLAIFGYSIGMFGMFILIPLYDQSIRHSAALDAGLLVAPVGVGAIVTMPLAGRLADKVGSRVPGIAGLLIALAGIAMFTRVGDDPGRAGLTLAAFVIGLGHGLITPSIMAAAYRTLPRTAIPAATTGATIMVRVGSALGAAVLAVVLQLRLDTIKLAGGHPAAAFADSFWWAFGFAAIALVPAVLLPAAAPSRPALATSQPD
jgi:EmrB/QacA subfamily drug resistance transporter